MWLVSFRGQRGMGRQTRPDRFIIISAISDAHLHVFVSLLLSECHPALNTIHSFIHSFFFDCVCVIWPPPTPLFSPRPTEWMMAQLSDVVLFPGGAAECTLPGSSVPVFPSLHPSPLLSRAVCSAASRKRSIVSCHSDYGARAQKVGHPLN